MEKEKVRGNDFAFTHAGALTKREYFAALAMQSLVSNPSILTPRSTIPEDVLEAITQTSILLADALIDQLNK